MFILQEDHKKMIYVILLFTLRASAFEKIIIAKKNTSLEFCQKVILSKYMTNYKVQLNTYISIQSKLKKNTKIVKKN